MIQDHIGEFAKVAAGMIQEKATKSGFCRFDEMPDIIASQMIPLVKRMAETINLMAKKCARLGRERDELARELFKLREDIKAQSIHGRN